MRYKLLSFCLTVWILFLLPVTVSAQSFDPARTGSISVTLTDPDSRTPISGAELSVYYVASVRLNEKNNLCYTFDDAFADCGAALDDPALSAKLDVFAPDHALPAAKLMTDAYGQAVFADLPLGLYFVKQTNSAAEYAPCTPFLVTVPYEETDGYVYDINASPKTELAKLTSVTVRKVWNTDASTEIAGSVTVQLLKYGAVMESAELSEANNWQVTFADMPESDGYSVLEVNVPEGFTATYSQNGYVFTVTNSASLIQTGQPVWPVPVLAMAGLILIAAGVSILRKSGDDNA